MRFKFYSEPRWHAEIISEGASSKETPVAETYVEFIVAEIDPRLWFLEELLLIWKGGGSVLIGLDENYFYFAAKFEQLEALLIGGLPMPFCTVYSLLSIDAIYVLSKSIVDFCSF